MIKKTTNIDQNMAVLDEDLRRCLVDGLIVRSLHLALAESCTGGLIAAFLTALPGVSACFNGSYVSYSNAAKCSMLGVRAATLDRFGAVSEEVVKEMAEGALQRSGSALSAAVSGIAGPGGGTESKPCGTVCVAIASTRFDCLTLTFHFSGDRQAVRVQTVNHVLELLIAQLSQFD